MHVGKGEKGGFLVREDCEMQQGSWSAYRISELLATVFNCFSNNSSIK